MKYDTRDIAMTMSYNQETGVWDPGDIDLSAPALDVNDRIIPETVDLHTRSGYENLKQMLAVRFLTRRGDYTLRPALGQDLNRIMSRRISKELIEEGKALIIRTITYDNFIEAGDLSITGIPFDRKTILYTIAINTGPYKVYRFNLTYEADTGVWNIT